MTITTIPLLLGSGIPLFNDITKEIKFMGVESKTYSHGVIQSIYKRVQ
jgi:dihydrofolate reductase